MPVARHRHCEHGRSLAGPSTPARWRRALVWLLGLLVAHAAPIWSAEHTATPYVTPLPPGSALVECEDFADSQWHRYEDAQASAGAKILANDPACVAGGSIDLPPGARYAVWVRSNDNGHYPGRYHYRLTIDDTPRQMADVEPLGHQWIWEQWGQIGPGAHTLRLDSADHFPATADCMLFVPVGADYRPSGRPLVRASIATDRELTRRGGRFVLSFTPTGPIPDQSLHCALRRGTLPVWTDEIDLPTASDEWPVDRPTSVTVSVPPLPMVSPGQYSFSAELSGCEYTGHQEGDYVLATATLGPWEPKKPCVAQVRPFRSTPTLFINDKPVFGFMFLGTGTGRYNEFAATGAHLYSVSCGIGNNSRDGFDPTHVDAAFAGVLKEDPDAFILPRIGVSAPAWWLEDNPAEAVVYDDGGLGPQSMASATWLRDVGQHLTAFVNHVRSSPYADRVIGFHICSGVSAEWQAWGMWSDRMGDFSLPMRRAFAQWLKNKYRTSEALADAWGADGVVDIEAPDGVPIPSREERQIALPVLLDPGKNRRLIDFYEFYPAVTAAAIKHFAGIIKQASQRQALVGVFYGYAPQYGPKAVESQHLALASVLACPDVDFLCSPAMYSDRQPGGTTNFMSLTDSVQLHGKYWFDEADIRTHLQENEVGRCKNMRETLGVLKREYGAVRAHGVGMWWFEMSDGWFSHPRIHDLFSSMRSHGRQALRQPPPPAFRPQIGVFLHEKSAFRHAPGAGSMFHHALTTQIASLRRVGAPVALHLLSDLAAAPDYKLNILLNANDLTADERTLIDARLKRDGKTVLFVYAAGLGRVDATGAVTEDPANMQRLTGLRISMSRRPGSARAHLAIASDLCADPVLIDAYGGKHGAFGPQGDIAPRFFLQQDAIEVIAHDSEGHVVTALKQMDGWTAVYSATPGIPPGILHNLARRAGAHMFTDAGSALYAGRGTLTVHARQDGDVLISFPAAYDVRGLFEGQAWQSVERISVPMRAADTIVLGVSLPAGGTQTK